MFDFYNLTLAAAVLAVVEIMGILLAVDAVMRPRSSQAAIAWSIALIALPVITIPLYVIFGRTRFHGYAEALREKEALIGEHLADWFSRMAATAAEPHEGLEAVEDLVRGLTNIPFTRGNCVELLVDGEATYAAMLDAIAAADSYVLVQFYIVTDSSPRKGGSPLCRAGLIHLLLRDDGLWDSAIPLSGPVSASKGSPGGRRAGRSWHRES
jgi:cardiolipin synthase